MSDLAAALAELRTGYAAELPGLVRELGALLDAAATDAGALARARQAAHRLRGTAGSYGFVEVGEAAGRIEDALEEGADGGCELAGGLAALQAQVLGAPPKSSGSSK